MFAGRYAAPSVVAKLKDRFASGTGVYNRKLDAKIAEIRKQWSIK
jgi:hypothetical protein